MSAYVEIIFDNSDGRFPTGNDELILRRTIGLKKDEYSLDRRNATKADVMNILETAGFNRANPYYIVPQGRITRLTNMKDGERLDLLKSVAGTQQFVAKKEESQKIMNETNNKLSAIDATFDQINERLAELEEEQEELRNFQEQDREKRGIEYTLYHRELDIWNEQLADIDERREGGIDRADDNRDRFNQGEDELAGINQQLDNLRRQMEAARLEKKQFEDERREKAKANAQVELDVRNMSSGQAAAQQARAQRENELQQLRTRIEQNETDLNEVLPQYNAEKEKEDSIKARLDEAETSQHRLFAKQGRNARFRTKRERDEWLQAQIDETFEALSRFRATRMQTSEGIVEDRQAIEQLEKEIADLQAQISGQGGSMADIDQEIQTAQERREKLIDDRKELWRREAHLDSDVSAAQDQLRKAERSLSHMMDNNTSRGLDSMRRIKQQYKLEGCYGTLAELIEVGQHHTAIETTAGASLFHYVVDNDDTATKAMEILNRERSGRLTFMPLNRLQPKTATFPNAQDARPLMSLMKYDPMYEKAVQQVFGKSIICQNLTVAAQYARTHGLNAVTPDGDRSDKKGALTGGYHDVRSSRLKATKAVVEAREKYDAIKANADDVKQQIQKIDQTVTKAIGEVQKLEQRRAQARAGHGPLRQELRSKMEMLERKRNDVESKQKQEAAIASRVQLLSDQQGAHEAEMATPFRKELTQAEETQLETLTNSIQGLRREYNALAASRAEIEARKTELEVILNTNLRPQLDAYESDELENGEARTGNLESKQRELQRLTKDMEELQRRINDIEDSLETSATQYRSLEAQAAETKRQQEELAKDIEKQQRRLERSIQKRSRAVQGRQECLDNLRELGAVPEESKTKYRSADSGKLEKKLKQVKEALKKYTSVNKHAFEHYRKSTKQREDLESRRTDLEAARKSIQTLIEVLDQRKDEAIERTFKQVSKNFAQIFTKLVPAGGGRLIIQRKTDRRAEDEEESEGEQLSKRSVENYTGVGISVSFNSRHDDQQKIQQLSGGQKSKLNTRNPPQKQTLTNP